MPSTSIKIVMQIFLPSLNSAVQCIKLHVNLHNVQPFLDFGSVSLCPGFRKDTSAVSSNTWEGVWRGGRGGGLVFPFFGLNI